MRTNAREQRVDQYIAIIDRLLAKQPKMFVPLDIGLMNNRKVEIGVCVTEQYMLWLTSVEGDDVSNVHSAGQEVTFASGKEAVEYLLMQSVCIVRQLLLKGVDPVAALGLLPSALAARAHAEYWNVTGLSTNNHP